MVIIFLLIAFFAFIFILIQLYEYEESKDERDIASTGKKREIISAGKRGEKIAFDVLNCLPEEYCIYENIRVTYNGKTSELDNIVVGPTGIFIVEVKNHKGIISGDYDEKDWLQEKIVRYGGRYDKTLYNPVKQVKTHIYRLANYLKENGIHTYIEGIVLFTNEESSVNIMGTGEVPVFSLANDDEKNLLLYIENRQYKMERKQIDKAKNLIIKLQENKALS